MLVVEKITDLHAFLSKHAKNKKVGLVPTMGALHQAHLSLIKESQKKCDITIATIFVNPKQFNKQADLDNYPKTLAEDTLMLESVSCDVLFCPAVLEMYPDTTEKDFDFGELETLMEGEHRPGHFNGVATVIERFFDIINPDYAFFGEKDFQQLAVINALVEQLNSPVQVVGCATVREKSGLAMSSRNKRLSIEEKEAAADIYKALKFVAENKNDYTINQLKEYFINTVDSNNYLKTEYFEIVGRKNLQPIINWEESNEPMAFTAVNIRDVRLIDNVAIIN